MHVVESGFISDLTTRPADWRFATFAGLCPLASGDLISVFQVGREKQDPCSTIGLCRSRDGGVSWQPIAVCFSSQFRGVPGSLAGAEMVEAAPGRLMLCTTWFDRSDPSRPLFDSNTQGILPTKQLRAISQDDGESWSEWEEISVGELKACALTGPPIRWSDGTLALPFESYKEHDDPRPAQHAARLLLSYDGGNQFSDVQTVAQHREGEIYYWDQRLCALPAPGEYFGMFWTHDLASQKDLTVHMRRGSIYDFNESESAVYATNIRGQIAAPAVLEDGRWVAFVVDRAGPCTLKLWVSHDEGRTWPEQESLVVYRHDERAKLSQGQEDVDYRQYWDDMLKWTFGHPAIRVLNDGKLLLAFYAGSPEGTSIQWSKVDPGKSKSADAIARRRIHSSAAALPAASAITSAPSAPHLRPVKAQGLAENHDKSDRFDLEIK